MSDALMAELMQLRTKLTERWSLTPDHIGAIMASLFRLSPEARNAVLQELLTQEFYTETDMLTEFKSRDQEFTDRTILVWLLNEITEYRQKTVDYFQTLTSHMTVVMRLALFRHYLKHDYVVGQKMGMIWHWLARVIAFCPMLPASLLKQFVLEVHKAHTHHLSGTVQKAEPLLMFMVRHGMACKTKEELLNWRITPEYLELKEEIDFKAAAERDKSPTRKVVSQ